MYRLVNKKHSVYPKDMSVHKSMKIQNKPQTTKLPLSLLPQRQGSAPLNNNLWIEVPMWITVSNEGLTEWIIANISLNIIRIS